MSKCESNCPSCGSKLFIELFDEEKVIQSLQSQLKRERELTDRLISKSEWLLDYCSEHPYLDDYPEGLMNDCAEGVKIITAIQKSREL